MAKLKYGIIENFIMAKLKYGKIGNVRCCAWKC